MGNENSSNSGMKRMPPFLWANIFSYLDRKDLESAALVSENWHALIKSPLPPHIMGIVFRNLSVTDQKNCLKVSKVWKDLIENLVEVKKSVIFGEEDVARMTSEQKVLFLSERKEFVETVEVRNRDPSLSLVDIFSGLLECKKLHTLRLVMHSKDLPVEDELVLLQLLQSPNHIYFKWLLLVAYLPPPGGRVEVDMRVEDAYEWTAPWYMDVLNSYMYRKPGNTQYIDYMMAGGMNNPHEEANMMAHMNVLMQGHMPFPALRVGYGIRGRGGYALRGAYHHGGQGPPLGINGQGGYLYGGQGHGGHGHGGHGHGGHGHGGHGHGGFGHGGFGHGGHGHGGFGHGGHGHGGYGDNDHNDDDHNDEDHGDHNHDGHVIFHGHGRGGHAHGRGGGGFGGHPFFEYVFHEF